ncbi:MAG: flagellar biosynthesis protein FliQ [Nitrospinales bacterium]
MTHDFIINFAIEALKTGLLISAPMLGFALTVGLLIAVFQSATSINDMTLSYIPKILAVFVALILFLPWMINIMSAFTSNLFISFPSYVS